MYDHNELLWNDICQIGTAGNDSWIVAAPFLQREVAMMQPAGGYESERMQAFAEAVDDLSVAFAAIGKKEELSSHESVTVLEEEITAKMCSSCDACAICWGAAKHVHTSKIRRMLQAVVAHNSKEDIIESNYMENCPCYRGMVEEAVWAFSRMELNEAWSLRRQDNTAPYCGTGKQMGRRESVEKLFACS